ncbi:MoaD/ThiS family protein [Anaerosacchariphilus polymeriproducens]|uniref:MoaD/ThiS family protein n=1 Tax=Anaerosacchariphilus polymeriproducens TaxID=1812858 RepID=A0A371AXW6_9FIRM|nr:MoaD/ThiS family protein [Anaerosacchariphilus polymeriproducens]RDU24401.1 hypothetical protein DWV06_05360 [Anaerosacchariphilus polymeriproducens]
MKIKINYLAQVKNAAGLSEEVMTVEENCSLKQLVTEYLCKKNKELKDLFLKENGEINHSILIFVGDEQAKADDSTKQLDDGAELTIMTPIAGG